ncbi:uncharacterized protein LOC114149374 isoform X2 [Xiphophorus couchianus]|uniref:uncharacterized protein LOC114149374 isoform X2 n=1 Tax=Xiphophorus couchianus TaxID=32473 RepID=UPI00101650F4|nr:uncharacterized protein LOC114149374 isoform X2 [Xiphophorus couchianus]
MAESLFPSLTKVLGKELGPLVRSNWDYNFNWPLLTVVKIKTKKFGLFDSNGRYKPLRLKLTDLTKENLSLEPHTQTHMKDYESLWRRVQGVVVEERLNEVTGRVGVKRDSTDAMCPMTIVKEFVRDEDLAKLRYQTIKLEQSFVDDLNMKTGEKLAFVVQRFYNEDEVRVLGKASSGGKFGATAFSFVSVSMKSQVSGIKTFIIPQNKTFGFVLQKMMLDGNTLRFGLVMFAAIQLMKRQISKLTTLAQDMIGILEGKVDVWESLAGCGHLLPKLTAVLEEGCSLTQLEEALDPIPDGGSQPEGAAASFTDLVSAAAREQTEALQLLVCALADLPENIPAALIKSGPETLDRIMKIMEHLKTGAVEVPESLVRPLLETEELCWVGSFLKSGGYMEDPGTAEVDHPPAQLEALYISVRGISVMLQATDESFCSH